jgi:hypothetical protein
MKNMNKNIISVLIIILSAAFWVKDVISARNQEIIILKPITLVEQAPQYYPKSNNEIGKLSPGEQVKVLRMGYGKDFRAWKVKGSMGQEGWFVEKTDSIKITNRTTNSGWIN